MTPGDPPRAIAAQPWLDELLDGSLEGIALFEPGGRIVRHNDRLSMVSQQPSGRLAGLAIEALFEDGTWRLALAAARGRGHWSGRLTVNDRELEVRLHRARDGYGVIHCRDVSEHAELDRRAESLAAMVEEHASRAESARELLFEQSERLTTVYQITLDALESATVSDTAARICESLAAEPGIENVALWIHDARTATLRQVGAVGERAELLPELVAVATAPNAAEALATRRAVAPRTGGALSGFAAFPLLGRNALLGVVTLDSAEDLDKLQLYGAHVGAAINNAILADELTRANRELLEIDQQKSHFLNVVAHDLRTPLTCIRTYADLLQMYVDEPPETSAQFLAIISEETERLGELLDKFLDLARIENATMRYDPEPVRIDELARHFESVYRARAEEESLTLTLTVDDDLPVISADRRRVEQVFSNLLSNAVRFASPGGTIHVAVNQDGRGVRVRVADNGPGVPEADRERVFERFRQAANNDRSSGGVGLGLAIAHGIVADHGGRIWVDENPGGGARFSFSLPAEPPIDCAVGRGAAQ